MSALLGEELLVEPPAEHEAPPALREFAEREGLTSADMHMLAAINFRGERPQDLEAWSRCGERPRLAYDERRPLLLLTIR